MCSTCGCGQPDDTVKILLPGEENGNSHHHDHDHDHSHHHDHSSNIDLEKNILHENDLLAQRNRGYLDAKNILTLNMVSSPGSGKTTVLEETVKRLKNECELSIIEGDQQTMQDADRIAATGAKVVQVNTGKGCHLDAHMVLHAIKKLEPKQDSFLFIENVGNLVCPSLFDLGENKRVVIISTTEGDDKPLKYPYMFESSHLCIINKVDLLPYVNFSIDKTKEYALRINHNLEFMEVSATTGQGMESWVKWLIDQRKAIVNI